MTAQKTIFLIFMLPLLSWSQLSQPRDIDFVKSFIAPFKTQDVKAISAYINFPLDRPYPIENIRDSTDFIKRFDEVFNKELIEEITSSSPEENWTKMGYQGIMLHHGSLWLDPYDKKLISVNRENQKTKQLEAQYTETYRASLHPSLRIFKTAILSMETKQFKIVIDRLEDGSYRFASWRRLKKMSQKPDVVILEGQKDFEGSGGNHFYTFRHKTYTYICHVYVLGFKNIPAELQILKGETLFHSEVASSIDY